VRHFSCMGILLLNLPTFSSDATPSSQTRDRFDRKVYVAPPTLAARETILRIQLSKMPHEAGIDVAALAVACDGFSGAEVVAICREGGPSA
jgi:AAA family ATPase